jgi:hypothetical protein
MYKLVDSLQVNNTDADIFVRLVDFTPAQFEEVRSTILNDRVRYIHDKPNLSNRKDILKDVSSAMHYVYEVDVCKTGSKNIKKLLYSKRSVYTCHSRFKTINMLLNEGYTNVLSLDVDTVINKDINHMFHDHLYDVSIVPAYIDDKIELWFNEGLLHIGNTPESIGFFKNVEDFIFGSGRYFEWNIDSEALGKCFTQRPGLRVGHLDDTYKDREFNDDSYMWSGDSVCKYNEKFK